MSQTKLLWVSVGVERVIHASFIVVFSKEEERKVNGLEAILSTTPVLNIPTNDGRGFVK